MKMEVMSRLNGIKLYDPTKNHRGLVPLLWLGQKVYIRTTQPPLCIDEDESITAIWRRERALQTAMGSVDDEFDLNNPPFPLTAIDRKVLATPDDEFHRYTWDDLRQIVVDNDLEALKRFPSDLHRYLRWSHDTKRQYGSINNFVMKERLHWTLKDSSLPVSRTSFTYHSATPFADVRDFVVLANDWPYGIEHGIKHLVVWTRTPIDVDDDQGDLTPESRDIVEKFVDRYFVQSLAKHRGAKPEEVKHEIMWFKNWVRLQSIPGIDHVHVMVKAAPPDLLETWLAKNDMLEKTVDFMDGIDLVFIDSMTKIYLEEDGIDEVSDSPPDNPFKGKSPDECSQMLLELRQAGSDINYECFAIFDDRTLVDGSVLVVEKEHRVEGGGVNYSVRMAMELANHQIGLYFVAYANVPSDQIKARRHEDNVLRAEDVYSELTYEEETVLNGPEVMERARRAGVQGRRSPQVEVRPEV
nr:hypothetical protein B0A51_04977 [Rachicladosporium sp. CCFEE 5018]